MVGSVWVCGVVIGCWPRLPLVDDNVDVDINIDMNISYL